MFSEADYIIDRRRIRRKLTFWRVAAIVVAVVAILAYSFEIGGETPKGFARDHIAKIRIDGTILEDEELAGRLEKAGRSAAVKGIILSIDSPGGTTAGGEMLFDTVRRIAREKPVVAQVGTIAASAGYMIASAADHIVARHTSIVGSIGVLAQFPDVTGLMEKLGVELVSIKSSPLKAEPNPFNQTTEEEREVLRAMIMDSYNWFVDIVADRRPLSRAETQRIANGAVFTGRQGKELKLVDTLGGEREAQEWLESKGVAAGLDVIEWKKPDGFGEYLFFEALARSLAGRLGLNGESLPFAGRDRFLLDGLLSVWHPEAKPL